MFFGSLKKRVYQVPPCFETTIQTGYRSMPLLISFIGVQRNTFVEASRDWYKTCRNPEVSDVFWVLEEESIKYHLVLRPQSKQVTVECNS
ncbi:hypothetical protein TNCV_69071 [Trichonephila clavipes]|nr:hypothetical protein TNCV_69071 [Trichonephila clavipes]